ncbi:MAG TPA: GON domain-containing protein [Actinotalea sp.]|jgi:LPXTG-motif cell wall-anchored protein
MPNAVVARLLTAGLASAALLAPGWAIAPASAVSTSASCADVLLAQPTAPDGEYEITVFDKTVTVWCADMATTPVEYLTLPNTGGSYNFSQDTFFVQVTTHYTRVRLNLPSAVGDSFSVDPTDDRFATSDGAPQRTWGSTGSCFNQPNSANLDLTGTPFGMSTDNFVHSGWGSTTMSANTQVIDVFGGGDCGGVYAANPFPLSWLYTAPSVTTNPADQTVASGADATFTASGTGTPTPTVTWQSSSDGTTWTDVTGAPSGTLTVPAATYALDGTLYRALISSDQGTAVTSSATLTVTPIAPGVSDPSDTTVVSGNDATFSVTVTGDPTPTIQWQLSTDGTSWSDIDGATALDLVLPGVTTDDDGFLVRAVATSTAGTDTSASAQLTVDPSAPTVTDPADVSAASGGDATFSVEVTGDPAPTVQWQTSADGVLWTDVAGATRTDLVLSGVTTAQDGHAYRAIVTNAGGSATSGPATLSVAAAAPVITTAPVARTVDVGDDAVFTAAATGDPAPTYQWQTSVDGVYWTDVAGATTGTLTLADVTAAQNGLWVRVYTANDGGAAASDGVRLTVLTPAVVAPTAPVTPVSLVLAALAVTGGSPATMLMLAGTLLVAGAGSIVLARRRRTTV